MLIKQSRKSVRFRLHDDDEVCYVHINSQLPCPVLAVRDF